MNIELSAEALLTQLGYTPTEKSVEQIKKTIDSTNGFENFSKHLLALHDELAHIKGIVALSNSKNVFKIKGDMTTSKEIQAEFNELIKNWSTKYKIKTEKVANKLTYYILGQ
jgi:ATP/maltotriose-dependent transcriptional regulator MalT